MNRSRLLRLLACAATSLAAAAPALAQQKNEAPQAPFDIQGMPHEGGWIPWLFAFLLAVACLAVAFKNPRRSHLD